ncbi:MAG: bifunctional enoyl-CoA hydratase/phosphate acetyltransferase [Spirochaetales bacterium]|uniref:Bifunctional enoyl-CoA hydratase/phosphate acetyltransferase n=1 Tax=Candidatus Thalassospirochaeta sargassi TaxID=3119039 RepID=A0AAJ1IFB3_9SPIO|nr:bifunctional enoyl-CoA hydratase/phosphate acetyltransferase [Spirochaetales bacterium]
MIKSFTELETAAKKNVSKKVVLAMAEEADALKAVSAAAEADVIIPILVGNAAAIASAAKEASVDISNLKIVEADGEKACAAKAVELIREGIGDCLMKGKTATATIMKAVLDKNTGLRGSGVLSHVAILNPPTYHKLIVMTDSALNIAPELKEKVAITENALSVSRKLGVEKPRVAVIGAVEKVNPAMPATIDAAALSKMADRGQIKNCIIDGPFALDNAISSKSCEIKGIKTEVGGDADVLLFPDIEAANVFYKSLAYLTDYPIAGLIVGADVPVILTSRSDSDDIKYYSILAGVSLV